MALQSFLRQGWKGALNTKRVLLGTDYIEETLQSGACQDGNSRTTLSTKKTPALTNTNLRMAAGSGT